VRNDHIALQRKVHTAMATKRKRLLFGAQTLALPRRIGPTRTANALSVGLPQLDVELTQNGGHVFLFPDGDVRLTSTD